MKTYEVDGDVQLLIEETINLSQELQKELSIATDIKNNLQSELYNFIEWYSSLPPNANEMSVGNIIKMWEVAKVKLLISKCGGIH